MTDDEETMEMAAVSRWRQLCRRRRWQQFGGTRLKKHENRRAPAEQNEAPASLVKVGVYI